HEKTRDDQYRTQSRAGAGHADQVMHADEIEQIGGTLATSLDGRLHGVGFMRDPTGAAVAYLRAPPGGPILVVVDGIEVSGGLDVNGNNLPFDINQIPSSQIETVEVLRFARASVYGIEGGNGVLVITTKQGGGRDIKDIASIGVLPITPTGFYKAREFYSPKYENTNVSWQHDHRSTIYWQPEVQTGKDGRATVDYFNGDGAGTY